MRFNRETRRWNRRLVKQILTRDVIVAAVSEYDRFFASFGRASKKYLSTQLEPRELGGIMGIAWEKVLFKAMSTHITLNSLGLLEDVGADALGAGGDFVFTDNDNRSMVLEVKITGQRTPNWITNTVALMRKDHLTRPVNYILTARGDSTVFSATALAIGPNDWNMPRGKSKSARASSFDKSVFLQKGRSVKLIGKASRIGTAGGVRLEKGKL